MPTLLQPGDPLDEDYDAKATRTQYVVLSNALEQFRKRWHNEYLLALREKHYNLCAVLITNVYPDERGVILTVEVEECGQRFLHPVTYLVPLELECHQNDDSE